MFLTNVVTLLSRYDYPEVPYDLENQKWEYKLRPSDCNLAADEDGIAQRECIPFTGPLN